jgi:hypothetical protein
MEVYRRLIRSETSDYTGPVIELALQPGADQPLDKRPGDRYEEKEAEQICEKAGGEKEHPTYKDHGTIQELGGGEPSLGQFVPDAAQCVKPLGADQPGSRKVFLHNPSLVCLSRVNDSFHKDIKKTIA